jgi:hypothetical protein
VRPRLAVSLNDQHTQLRGTIFGISKTGLSWLRERLSSSKKHPAKSRQWIRNRQAKLLIGVRFPAKVDISPFSTPSRPTSYPTGYQDLVYQNTGAVEAYLQVFLSSTEIERSPSVSAAVPGHRVLRIHRICVSASARADVHPEELSITSYSYRKSKALLKVNQLTFQSQLFRIIKQN